MRHAIFIVPVAFALTACQSQTTVTAGGHTRVVSNNATEKMSLDQAIGTDPCAERLRDIEGALLMYYALHKQMPPSLQELAPLADLDTPLNFTSPVTGAPFGYNAAGMPAPGRSKRIIVYETVPEHVGKRWCIRMPLTDPTAAQSAEVVEIPEADFGNYLPN